MENSERNPESGDGDENDGFYKKEYLNGNKIVR